jgi:hypothetical protein
MPTKRQPNPQLRVFLWALLMFASPAIQIIIALVIALVGFGGGWGVKGWKDGATVAQANSDKEKVESKNAILVTANGNCATDIEGVKKGVAVVVAQVEEREKAASAAMKAADVKIAQRKVKPTKELPTIPPTPDAQCAAIEQEQKDYVQGRKNGN